MEEARSQNLFVKEELKKKVKNEKQLQEQVQRGREMGNPLGAPQGNPLFRMQPFRDKTGKILEVSARLMNQYSQTYV